MQLTLSKHLWFLNKYHTEKIQYNVLYLQTQFSEKQSLSVYIAETELPELHHFYNVSETK